MKALPVQSGVYGTGWSSAASCSAGISQPVARENRAVPASENAVADAATPHAMPTAATTVSHRRPAKDRPRTPGTRAAGSRASRPTMTSSTPPMNMTCAMETSGGTR